MRGWEPFIMPRFSCLFCVALALVLFAPRTAFSAPAPEASPTALQIFDAALAKFESDRVALRKRQYHQTLTTHQVDSGGKVVAKGTWKSIVRPGDPRPLEYTAESMEGKLSFFKAGAEEPASASKPATAEKPKAAKDHDEKNQAESAVEAVRKYNLRDRYIWKHVGNENASGESAYVLTFEPKPKQNTRSREERFFGQLAGRLWVSRSDYSVLKAEAALQSPAHLFWVIARVTKFRLTYKLESDTGSGRLFRHSKATARTEVAFPFYVVRQRHWLSTDKYEPRTPRGTRKPPPLTSPTAGER
jgi:hypothetical protein